MKENLTAEDITQGLIDAVTTYLARRAKAEIIREEVGEVEREVLANAPLYNDLEVRHGLERKRIVKPGRVYLSEDETALSVYYGAVDLALRKAGIKPDDMEPDHCPALVAERAQTEAEWALLDEAAKMLGVYEKPGSLNGSLLCMKNGLKERQRFIDLVVGLVLALES